MAQGTLIGRFSICGGGELRALASVLCEERLEIVEIKKDGERYSVSSLSPEEAPKKLWPLFDDTLTDTDSMESILVFLAGEIFKGDTTSYFLRSKGSGYGIYIAGDR